MRPAILLLLLLATCALGFGQTFDQYLRMRDRAGITQAVGVEALETLVGTRLVEVAGVVKGSFRVGERSVVLLEKSDGDTMDVEATAIPEWLVGNEVPARLLVSASRASDVSQLRATLVGAAPEARVRAHEVAEARKRAEAARRKPPPKTAAPVRAPRPKGREWELPASEVTPIYAAFIKQRNRRLSNAEAMRIAQGIVGFSLRFGVDARLIMAMVMTESGFNPNATSRAGAMGLGQLMPGTARGLGVSNAYDSVENLYGTVKLVRNHLTTFRRRNDDYDALVLTLASYNAGPGAVRRHGGVPPFRETRNYVRKVIGLYEQFTGRR